MTELPASEPRPIHAAEYIRKSTDHQKYSIDSQQAAIRAFADAHDMVVAATYADAGRSGLTVRGRPGLKRLLAEVRSGILRCQVILVYDVTRWGRFQDPDEAAFHEFVCKRAGYRVVYCAEPFSGDGPLDAFVKGLKRVMAGEYSRELSVKVYDAQKRAARLGIWCNGGVGYGFRRAVVDARGRILRILDRGKRRSRTDRGAIVFGPTCEVETVRRIFRMFADEGRSVREIVKTFAVEAVPAPRREQWHVSTVRKILGNERYVGNFVWGRRAQKLGGPVAWNPPEEWIRIDDCFPAIVDANQFARARSRVRGRGMVGLSDDEMIELLRQLLARNGYLSADLIEKCKDAPCFSTYYARFGSMARICELVGCQPLTRRDYPDQISAG
jgi:DNA invertase Pin-like site-specific DNA recombinase